ncbi:MAG: Asp-tRNA(Asn)/Glu-tRNA(Gln) amidotransferase subunit GatC [Deltaproteobacteria bacterium]|nr:Asp-tRNA(Asn)/Glu-tRNA(Gln) amidotransferase subunit GatC [Deltaproteobacteria bacterium]
MRVGAALARKILRLASLELPASERADRGARETSPPLCSDADLIRVAAELEAILEYVETIGELTLDDVPPMGHGVELVATFRDDIADPSIDRDAALRAASQHDEEAFLVPKVIEG